MQKKTPLIDENSSNPILQWGLMIICGVATLEYPQLPKYGSSTRWAFSCLDFTADKHQRGFLGFF